jgi:hypothetical protein
VPAYLVDIVQSMLVLAFVVPSVVTGIVQRRRQERRAAGRPEPAVGDAAVAA